jgi:hypothetical protein
VVAGHVPARQAIPDRDWSGSPSDVQISRRRGRERRLRVRVVVGSTVEQHRDALAEDVEDLERDRLRLR